MFLVPMTPIRLTAPTATYQLCYFNILLLFFFFFFLDFCWYLLLSFRVLLSFVFFSVSLPLPFLFILATYSFVFLFYSFLSRCGSFDWGFCFYFILFYLDVNIWRILGYYYFLFFWDWYVLLLCVNFDTSFSTTLTNQFECQSTILAHYQTLKPTISKMTKNYNTYLHYMRIFKWIRNNFKTEILWVISVNIIIINSWE